MHFISTDEAEPVQPHRRGRLRLCADTVLLIPEDQALRLIRKQLLYQYAVKQSAVLAIPVMAQIHNGIRTAAHQRINLALHSRKAQYLFFL